jgi:hypothetical protein
MFIGKEESRKQYILNNLDRTSNYELANYFLDEFYVSLVIKAYFKKLKLIKMSEKSYFSLLKWKESNPQKNKAHKLVFSAIRAGKLKSEPCTKCGENKTDAHHEDYSKPLEVIWFCHLCHGLRHKEIRLSTGS